jgi:hypothetical protein
MEDPSASLQMALFSPPSSTPAIRDAPNKPVIDISIAKLSLGALLFIIPLTISLVTRLALHATLLLAAARCMVQLLVLGTILRVLFTTHSLGWVLAYILFMMAVASLEAVSRPSMAYPVRSLLLLLLLFLFLFLLFLFLLLFLLVVLLLLFFLFLVLFLFLLLDVPSQGHIYSGLLAVQGPTVYSPSAFLLTVSPR